MKLKNIIFFVLFSLISPFQIYSQQVPLGTEVFGKGSYYGNSFYGQKTASGEILKKDEYTCAHPSLPFGTMLEVTNLANNKWCIVRVNDRGPYSGGRIIDLTHKGAKTLGMFGSGIIKVKIMIVGDHNIVYIGRPESVIENSMNLVKDDNEKDIQVPFKQDSDVVNTKHTKNISRKRANRRKN